MKLTGFIANIFRLGIKEIRSLRRDPALIVLIVYAFTAAVYSVATGLKFEVERGAVAIVDEDHSGISHRIAAAILPPEFKEPVAIEPFEIDTAMDRGRYTFVIEIPPRFEADVRGGRKPVLQIDVDATAMSQAGNGAVFLQNIVEREVADFVGRNSASAALPFGLAVRTRFNPNLNSEWFMSVMQVIFNITLLSVVLSGAALIREREQGTIEHLLVMPVTPLQIMLSKIWANGAVIVVSAILSLWIVVEWALKVPIAGSLFLFVAGAIVYQFSVTSLGILLATFTNSMPQFGLLVLPVLVAMNLLSGSMTPRESMPQWLQNLMEVSPSTHFVMFAQSVLYRDAGLGLVVKPLLLMAVIGLSFLIIALLRFRRSLAKAQ